VISAPPKFDETHYETSCKNQCLGIRRERERERNESFFYAAIFFFLGEHPRRPTLLQGFSFLGIVLNDQGTAFSLGDVH
jgi:hypothetical protein